MYCKKDCACSLCRELHAYKLDKSQQQQQQQQQPLAIAELLKNRANSNIVSNNNNNHNIMGHAQKNMHENFILRRRNALTTTTTATQNTSLEEAPLKASLISAGTPSPTPMSQAPDEMHKHAGSEAADKLDHKVVIYFGDSISNRHQGAAKMEAKRTPAQLLAQVLQRHHAHARQPKSAEMLKKEAVESSFIESVNNGVVNIKIEGNYQKAKALVKTVAMPTQQQQQQQHQQQQQQQTHSNNNNNNNCNMISKKTAFHANIVQGFQYSQPTKEYESNHNFNLQKANTQLSANPNDGTCDWSFVQEWRRSRHANHFLKTTTNTGMPTATANATPNLNSAYMLGLPKPAAMPTRPLHKEAPMKFSPPIENFTSTPSLMKDVNMQMQGNFKANNSNLFHGAKVIKPVPQRPVPDAKKLPPIQPLRAAPALATAQAPSQAEHEQNQSSSDENRSSGHASMSDTGGHGSCSPAGKQPVALLALPEERTGYTAPMSRSTRSRSSTNHSRPRQRSNTAKLPWNGNAVEDIKLAIQQLSLRSQTSTSSTYSSLSASSQHSEPLRRLMCQGSQETLNTNVTSADEFVWLDSHDRLVELKQLPWTTQCLQRVLQRGHCKQHAARVPSETLTRLAYLLQRCLVRLAREIQRLSAGFGLCSKQEVGSAFRIVLCTGLADACQKACLSAAAMFAAPGDISLKQSKSERAGLQLSVGRFHRWMTDTCLGKFVHEYAAVYLCAGMENLLETLIMQHLPADGNQLTLPRLEQAIAANAEWWGLLQPFAHLNAGRLASGELSMPRVRAHVSSSSAGSCYTPSNSSGSGSGSSSNGSSSHLREPFLLTTCVGSVQELKELTLRLQQGQLPLCHTALNALYYFMRCAQLEHGMLPGKSGHNESRSEPVPGVAVQELCHERAYFILPPLVEWLRVATAHAAHRGSLIIDRDDIMQSARLLLPGVDCPVRAVGQDEDLPSRRAFYSAVGATHKSYSVEDAIELGKRSTLALAFKLMLTGRAELLAQASSLLPAGSRFDTLNHMGMTALMIAATRNDDITIQALLDAGCDPNIEVPAVCSSYPAIHPDTQHWTAVTFAACCANYMALRVLLERGGKVEGGAHINEERPTMTPLQVACGSGNVSIVSLLLAHGANPYLSTQLRDPLCLAVTAQRGCYSAIAVAAASGQRACLRLLLVQPTKPASSNDVLSLEEMLAESEHPEEKSTEASNKNNKTPVALNKTQMKTLQEAMFHSSENNNLDITLEIRALGVPWTLHCWLHALNTAQDLHLVGVIDQLLQDFVHVCPNDFSPRLISDCLPLLFNIFRSNKNETTALLLADIFATSYGTAPIEPIEDSQLNNTNNARIDAKFVNNQELSDVAFRVEGKIFYGHRIVLVNASPRFSSMFNAAMAEAKNSTQENNGIPMPIVQINDIRYHIFQLVMEYLYSGHCQNLASTHEEVLELMAAASFFQLHSLLHYTEACCAKIVNTDNVVSMYIHAKVYNAQNLLSYCQGFLLQNMVALLTGDDCVKRLLFGKKIPNHDVISGLLQTLQQRITKLKCSGSASRVPVNSHSK